MNFLQTSSVIKVDMSVSRYRIFPDDNMVEIWGHVGDYEVCVHLSLQDAAAQELLNQQPDSPSRRQKKSRQH